MDKKRIKVFVTKTNKFRANISSFFPDVERFEITIGSDAYSRGKLDPFLSTIRSKIRWLIIKLLTEAYTYNFISDDDILDLNEYNNSNHISFSIRTFKPST